MPSAAAPQEEKTCVVCGRTMTWRKSWAKNWEQVRYCSDRCRRRGVKPVDHDLESAILDLLAQRSGSSTICPSEAARAVGGEAWRELMEPTRAAARRLQADGKVTILQKGTEVDPSRARGPIRIRRR